MKNKKTIKSYLFERDGHKCWFCSKELFYRQMSLDHYLPKSKGGPEEIFNYVLSCKTCNKLKRSRVPADYQEVWINLLKQAFKDRKIYLAIPMLDYEAVLSIMEEVTRLEALNRYVVFQSLNHRIYVRDNSIKKIIQIANWAD
ncbi:MAG: HNH endonuclease [Peptococcaceae bacterium]